MPKSSCLALRPDLKIGPHGDRATRGMDGRGKTPSQQQNAEHTMPSHTATFRFYEELNDFLPPRRRKRAFDYTFRGTPSAKDAIEAIGVPHVEVDLILVNGVSVDFGHRLANADRVAVYPVFERLDITPLVRLRERPLRNPRFVADVHLGKLVRRLRILGFDCLYRNDYSDEQIARLSANQARTVLTCDVGLLKRREVVRGRWVRARQPARRDTHPCADRTAAPFEQAR